MSATTDALARLNTLAGSMDRWAAKYGASDATDGLADFAALSGEADRIARVIGERSLIELTGQLAEILAAHAWTSEGQLRGVEYTGRAEFVTCTRVVLERLAKHTTQ